MHINNYLDYKQRKLTEMNWHLYQVIHSTLLKIKKNEWLLE